MSTENIQKFAAAAQADPTLQARVQSLQASPETLAENLATLSQEVGHPFTAEELLALTTPSNELSAAELETITGGTGLSDLPGFKQIAEALIPRKQIKPGDKIEDPWFT